MEDVIRSLTHMLRDRRHWEAHADVYHLVSGNVVRQAQLTFQFIRIMPMVNQVNAELRWGP